MRLAFFLLSLLSVVPAGLVLAQSTTTLTGTVLDARTQAVVPFASLGVPNQPGGTVTNAEGVFRLTLPARADSVRVQALGYAPLTVAAKTLAPATALTLRLEPQTYTLQEVSVTAFSPTTLLKRAVRRTTALMYNPVGLQAYYREFATYNGQIAKFADALVDYYIQGNPRRPRSPVVQARVRESRVGQAALNKDDAEMALPNPINVDKAGNYYDVTVGNPSLDSTNFKRYTYTLLETPAGAVEEPYYEVRCTPATQEQAYLSQLTVRIDRQTLAIQRIESEVPARLQPYMKKINILVVKMQVTQVRKQVEYQEVDGRLYPSFVRLQSSMNVTHSDETMRYDFVSEMLVRGLAGTPAPIAKNEQYNGSLYKRGTHYTRPYWREGNVVPATAAEEKVIATLVQAP
ncbi:MAG: carboxypeptidase-like regulatory domain-containing protein [Janthinobacterium lividum]